MKFTSISLFRSIQDLKYWLSAIGIGLIVLHLKLLWQMSDKPDQFSLRLLFLSALLSLLWKKRHNIRLGSEPFSIFAGLFLITLVLVESDSIHKNNEILLDVLLMLSASGFGLLSVGARRLKQYWRESLIVFLMSMPTFAIGLLLDKHSYFSISDAKVAAFLLWHLGFEVVRRGVYITLPNGGIEVASFCSGVMPMLTLLQLAFLFLLMFPTKLKDKILVPAVAVTLAFTVNIVRIVLMVLFVNSSNNTVFDYWHNGTGSQIFSLISMLGFGYFCKIIIQSNKPEIEH